MSKNLPISSCHIEKDTRKLVRERGYHEHPIIAPRWLVIPNSVYPLGPVFDALPDFKSLNRRWKCPSGTWTSRSPACGSPRTTAC
jgi:hypothetical protein